MKKILLFISLLISLVGVGQKIGNQLVDSFPINNWAVPQKGYGLLWLPSGAGPNTKVPLIINLAGQGEIGTGIAGLNQLLKASPQNLNMRISAGFSPSNVIVFSPEGATSPPNYSTLQFIIPDFIKRYASIIDTSAIYWIGYSNGAYGAMTAMSDDPVFCKRYVKGAVLISPAAIETQWNTGTTIINRVTNMYANVAANNIPIWFISGTAAFDLQYSDQYTAGINAITKGPKAIETRIPNVDHSAWLQGEDTAWRAVESGNKNYLEWMLGTSKTAGPVISTPPPVVVTQKADSAGIIKAYVASHPCPVTDSAGIGKAYALAHPCPVCPPPVVCPVCPPQRTVVKMINDLVAGICYLVYSDGYTQQISKGSTQ